MFIVCVFFFFFNKIREITGFNMSGSHTWISSQILPSNCGTVQNIHRTYPVLQVKKKTFQKNLVSNPANIMANWNLNFMKLFIARISVLTAAWWAAVTPSCQTVSVPTKFYSNCGNLPPAPVTVLAIFVLKIVSPDYPFCIKPWP